jgi:hypothetical protein
MPEQGTTQRKPVNINDDDSNKSGEDAMNEDYDASFNQIVSDVMSQKPQEVHKTSSIQAQDLQSHSAIARESPVRKSPARVSGGHPALDSLAQERAQRKPNFVGFNAAGPRNQGSRHMQKLPSSDIHDPPSEGSLSSDDNQYMSQKPPVTHIEVSGSDTQAKKTSDFEVGKIATHVDAVAALPHNTAGSVVGSKSNPTTGQSRKVVSVEIPTAKDKGSKGLVSSVNDALADDAKHTNVRLARGVTKDKPLDVNYAAVELRAQPGFSGTSVQDPPRQLSKKPETSSGKLHKDTVKINPVASMGKSKMSLETDDSRNLASIGSKRPGPDSHALALPTPSDSQVPSRVVQPRHIDGPSGTKVGKDLMPPAREYQEKIAKAQSGVSQTIPPGNDRKRPSTEMIAEPAKRPRSGTHKSTYPTRSPAARKPVSRRLSQVADNGSPIPYGVEMPQETVHSSPTENDRMSAASILPLFVTHQPVDVPFAQVTRSKHEEIIESDSPLEKVDALQQNSPIHMSQAVTHDGFDEDTSVVAEHTQMFEPQKDILIKTVSAPQENAPQTAQAAQRTLGLMEALRSEVVPQTSAQGAEGDDARNAEVDEAMEDEDPDKTLVNEVSDDGDDDDGDDSESQDSSDSDGDNDPKSGVSMWRKALESHQGEVYDQLVRIAHRLTEHLKDHETAIKDISTDYQQDGARLIERLEKDNEARLEQYCIKRSKMQGALGLGYEQVRAGVEKDMKDIKISRERHVKMLQRQVDAEGRLAQILHTYHP